MKKPPRSRYSRMILACSCGQPPFADLHGVEPRPVVDVVAVVQIHRLLGGAHVDARQTPHGLGEVTVGARVILGPQRQALTPVAIEAPAITIVRSGRIHQAGEDPLGLFLVVGREFEAAVFDAHVLPERAAGRRRACPERPPPYSRSETLAAYPLLALPPRIAPQGLADRGWVPFDSAPAANCDSFGERGQHCATLAQYICHRS